MRERQSITERQFIIQKLRCKFLLLFQKAKEQGINCTKILRGKGGRKRIEKLKIYIEILDKALLDF